MADENPFEKLRDDVDYLVEAVDGNVREGKVGLIERADRMKASLEELEERDRQHEQRSNALSEEISGFREALRWVFALPVFVKWAGPGGVILVGGYLIRLLTEGG